MPLQPYNDGWDLHEQVLVFSCERRSPRSCCMLPPVSHNKFMWAGAYCRPREAPGW